MIPQETIEQVREATDIVQIVGEYVRLKKKGRDMWACCPFHQEKTPSFKVSSDRQLFYCFGCGKGGNVITFLMEHEGMSFADAIRYLAGRGNILIRETRADQRPDEIEHLNYAHELAVEFYHKQLFEKRYSVVLDDYLRDKRGISDQSIEAFRLGLAGENWDAYLRFAGSKGLKPDELVKAGLVLKSEQKGTYFDRFRQRLMIPIFNLSNKPIAFGGRTLKKGEPAKYMNSPETPLYNKSRVLYGLNFSKESIRSLEYVFVVEGYFDFISLYQLGITNVVASSGTSFTPQQARLLARFAQDVYLFFDADSAGRSAALRSVDSLYDAGLEVRVISAPQGEDPDSLARIQGIGKIEELRAAALPFIDYRVKQADLSEAGIIEREKLVKELAALAGRIADPTRRELFQQESAQKLGVNQSVFQMTMTAPPTTSDSRLAAQARFHTHEFELLSLLLEKPGVIDFVFQAVAPEDFDSRLLGRLYAALETQYNQHGDFDVHRLIDNMPDEQVGATVADLASREWPADQIDAQTKLVVQEFIRRRQAEVRKRLKDALRRAEAAGDQQKANDLLAEMKQYGL
ncbi:MAG: DNA primase [Candidatus Zixiibacteriota bacterium]